LRYVMGSWRTTVGRESGCSLMFVSFWVVKARVLLKYGSDTEFAIVPHNIACTNGRLPAKRLLPFLLRTPRFSFHRSLQRGLGDGLFLDGRIGGFFGCALPHDADEPSEREHSGYHVGDGKRPPHPVEAERGSLRQ